MIRMIVKLYFIDHYYLEPFFDEPCFTLSLLLEGEAAQTIEEKTGSMGRTVFATLGNFPRLKKTKIPSIYQNL